MKFEKYFDRKQKHDCWRFDFTIVGQRIRQGGFAKKADAERAVTMLRLRIEERRYGIPGAGRHYTLGHLLSKRESDPTAAAQRQALQSLRWFVDFIGEATLLEHLTPSSIKSFLTDLQSEERKQSSVKTYLNQIHTALNSVENYFPNFDWTPPRFPKVKIEPGRDRILTAAELAGLLEALQAGRQKGEPEKGIGYRLATADLIRLALLVPARRGELLKLKTSDLNLDWGTISITSPKTKTVRVIPLSAIALQILRSRWPKQGKEFFPGMTAKQLITGLEKASELSGVPYGDNVVDGFVFHDLRHTAATIMSSTGIDYATIAELLGHKRPGMTHRYIHPSIEVQRKGIQALETFCFSVKGFITAEIDVGISTGDQGSSETSRASSD